MEDRTSLENTNTTERQEDCLSPIMTIDEVTEHMRISRRTVVRYILSGELRAYNPDNELLISRPDLIEFMNKWQRK